MADKFLDDYYDQPILSHKKDKVGKNEPKYSKKHIRMYQEKMVKKPMGKQAKRK